MYCEVVWLIGLSFLNALGLLHLVRELDKVTDEYGLVRDNNYLVVQIPALGTAFVYWVKTRDNPGYEAFHYGPAPLPSGLPCSSFIGGSLNVPNTGVIPPESYCGPVTMPPPRGVTTEDITDMWYFKLHLNKLYHVKQFVKPSWIRVDYQIPVGNEQHRFGQSVIGVGYTMGFNRGFMEFVVLPQTHYGFVYGNDIPYGVFTSVDIVYAQYEVAIPSDPMVIFKVITHELPAYYVTLPIITVQSTLRDALINSYGFEGFPIYPPGYPTAQAVKNYQDILNNAKQVLERGGLLW